MADHDSTAQDRARAVIDGLTGLVSDFPEESLALWAMIQDLRIISGLAADEASGTNAEAAE